MKIVTLCGCGLGTCFTLRFIVEEALREHGLKAQVVTCDLGSASFEHADIYLFPHGLRASGSLPEDARLVEIENVLDGGEIWEKLKPFMKSAGEG